MQTFPRKVLFQFQASLAVPLCLGIGAVWKCQSLFFLVSVQLSETSQTLVVYRRPSVLPSGESWVDGMCTDTFYPKEIIAWEPCLLHKSRQGYSDRLSRRQEGDVPSAEPFQDIPGLRGCLCSQGTLAFTPWFSDRTADDDKSLFQVKQPSTSHLKAPPLTSLALISI